MAAMNFVVEKPSAERVKAACEKYDREYELIERSLEELVRQYPHNTDPRHILLKVVAVNALEHTHIFAIDAVARHIHADIENIDKAMASGSPEVINQIAKVAIQGKKYNLYSFATKYCSLHNPQAYPVYDLRVDHYLCRLQAQHPFTAFHHAELCDYGKFVAIMTAFRDFHRLGAFSFKEIGKFIHLQGEPPALPLQEEIQTGPGAFDFFPAQELPS
jgi:hypothetical protein